MPKMCRAYKDIRGGDPKKYFDMVGDGKYICKKCGRTAADRKYLCCPMEISKGDIDPAELSYCSLENCTEKKVRKSKKFKKMKEEDLRRVIREEVYATIMEILKEIKE